MVGGPVENGEKGKRYAGHLTSFVVYASIVAASGGLIFGYDIGITGGVSSMDDFLKKFFPKVYRERHNKNNYCAYDNQGLQAFTSSLFLAGMVASVFASYSTRLWGRKNSMLIAGLSFLMGAVLNVAAENLIMLIIGRICLGIGVGFGNQVVPLYLSEIAPAHLRGALNMMFQLATTFGILIANLINYGTNNIHPWGWRLSLGLAAIPASVLTMGGIFLPETPNSLIERGNIEEGKSMLKRVRGVPDVEEEYRDLVQASRVAGQVKHPFRNMLQTRNRPQLVMAIFLPFFQIATGINSVLFYAPQLFQTIGFGSSASLYSAIIIGATLSLSTFVSIALVDRVGRMKLFYAGGVQMFLTLIFLGIVMHLKLGLYNQLEKGWAVLIVVLICIYTAGFGWSWGSLGWTVPSEIFPLETRSAGQSIVVSVNFFFTFVLGQALLTMLCHFKFGIFYFFGGLVFLMTAFVALYLPETKGVPLEEMPLLWSSHWFWKRIVPPPAAIIPGSRSDGLRL
ncbi:hypothetical protein Mapa_012655 [Marchantia paleacea]|nr:hypothetical protein Mapa_012655 [Marchantia paleacea]